MPSVVKEIMMKELVGQFGENPYAFISKFDGMNVADLSDLRRLLEKVSRRSLVVKHSLARKVFSESKLAGADQFLKGSVLVTFGRQDPQLISKTLVDFAKTNQKLVPTGVIFEKQAYGEDFVKRLARLPSRHELLTQVVVRVKSPITGLVLTLGQLARGLVVALAAIKDKKAAGAPAA